jgi:hypothetical protein
MGFEEDLSADDADDADKVDGVWGSIEKDLLFRCASHDTGVALIAFC